MFFACIPDKIHANAMTRRTALLLTFIVLKFLLQYFLIIPGYDLHRDEYLHLDQGNHLAWGFVSVPPVTSWIAWLIRALGNGEWVVRFFPALFGALAQEAVDVLTILNGLRAARRLSRREAPYRNPAG